MASSPWRLRPSFIIVGAQKSATSSLYDFIVKHPKVSKAEKKEIHYFDISYKKGASWYISHFPLLKKGFISGESTPSLLRLESSLINLKKDFPGIKVLVIFRDPVERTISHYFHNVRKGREKRSFLAAISSEESLSDNFCEPSFNSKDIRRIHYSYIGRSLYMRQLSYLKRIFNPSQLMLLRYSEVISINDETRQKIFRFLELEDFQIKKMSFKNKGHQSVENQICPSSLAFLKDKINLDRKLFLEKVGWDGF